MTRQGLVDVAQIFIAGIVIFGLLALVARYRGGSPRRSLQSMGILGALTVVTYVIAFTVAPNIPTPAVPFTARFQSNPVPDTAESIDAGRQIYRANCVICHGPRALGDGPQAIVLNPKPFNLQVHAPLHPTGEVFYWISNGVAGTGMPAWKQALTEEQRWQLIRYIDALAAKRIDQ